VGSNLLRRSRSRGRLGLARSPAHLRSPEPLHSFTGRTQTRSACRSARRSRSRLVGHAHSRVSRRPASRGRRSVSPREPEPDDEPARRRSLSHLVIPLLSTTPTTALHVGLPINALRLRLIVSAAQEPHVLGLGPSARPLRLPMVELEKRPLSTALAPLVHERAPEPIAIQHLAPRPVRYSFPLRRSRLLLRSLRHSQLLVQRVLDPEIERRLEDRRQIPARIPVTHQVPRERDLLLQLPRSRELHLDPIRR
jgi:hypothetical protein